MNNKMKILMLNYEFPPLGGGAGKATFNIAKELANLGHDVDVITSGYGEFRSFEEIFGIQVFKVKTHRRSIHDVGYFAMIEYVFKGWTLYKKLIRQNNYDIIHSFFSIPTGIIPYLGKILYGKDYIVSLRGSDVPGYDPTQFKLAHILLKSLNMKIWKNAKAIVALSNGLRKIAAKNTSKRIDVIYNGINQSNFCRKKQHKKTKIFKMVSVCRLLKRKGIQNVIKAMQQIDDKNILLDIYGTGNYEKKLQRIIAKTGMKDQVKLKGYVSNDKLCSILNKYDLFVHPSLTEALGNTFLEAMASGLPIIGSNVGGIPEVVIQGENGVLVEPNNVKMIKNGIIWMKKNPDVMKKMSSKNAKRIIEHFSWNRIAREYLKLYHEFTNQEKEKYANVLNIAPVPFPILRGKSIRVNTHLILLDELGFHQDLLTYPGGDNFSHRNVNIHRANNLFKRKNPSMPGLVLADIFSNLHLIFKAAGLLRRNKYNLIYAHDVDGCLIALISRFLSGKNTPLIYDMHGSFLELTKYYRVGLFSFLIKSIEKALYDRSNFIILNWPHLDKIVRTKTPKILIMDGPDLETYEYLVKKKIPAEGRFNGIDYVLYTGNSADYQRIDLIIDSLAFLPDNFHIVLAGEISKKYYVDDRRIHYTGYVKGRELVGLLQNAKVLISTRMTKGFPPMKIMFYLLTNVPIVATDISCHSMILKDNEDAILCKPQPKEIAAAIMKASGSRINRKDKWRDELDPRIRDQKFKEIIDLVAK